MATGSSGSAWSSIIGGAVNAGFSIAGAYTTDAALEETTAISSTSYLIEAIGDQNNAATVRAATELAASQAEAEGESAISEIRARAGATGLTQSSFTQVLNEAERNKKLDVLAVQIEGEVTASNYDLSATMNVLNSYAADATGEQQQDTNTLNTITSVIQGFM